jgi:beta-alanine degradation protein BauB
MQALPHEPPYGPIGTRIIYEDERLRVWEVEVAPGERQPLHEHTVPYIVICIEGGRNRITSLDGTVRETDEQPGDVVVLGPAIHELENIGTTLYQNRLIELKQVDAL